MKTFGGQSINRAMDGLLRNRFGELFIHEVIDDALHGRCRVERQGGGLPRWWIGLGRFDVRRSFFQHKNILQYLPSSKNEAEEWKARLLEIFIGVEQPI